MTAFPTSASRLPMASIKPELTLEKAKRAARQKEAVQEQQQSLRSDLKVPGTTDVDMVGQQQREQVRGPNTHSK